MRANKPDAIEQRAATDLRFAIRCSPGPHDVLYRLLDRIEALEAKEAAREAQEERDYHNAIDEQERGQR